MHGKNIHFVVVGKGRLLVHAVAEQFVINHVVASDKTREVEGFGRGIERDGAQLRVLTDGLCGDVLVARHGEVRPNLVAHDHHVVLAEQLHGLLQLPALPDSAAGVVRRADDGGVDLMADDLFFHVRIVHAPDTMFVPFELAVDDMVAVILQAACKADVGRAQDEDVVALGAVNVQRRHNAAQHAVFIANVLRKKTLHTVLCPLPVDDSLVIRIRRAEIAEERVPDSFGNGLRNGGDGCKVHVRDPHGKKRNAVLGRVRGEARHGADPVDSQRVHSMAVINGRKIVMHNMPHFCLFAENRRIAVLL